MSKLESKQPQKALLNSPCLAAAILMSVIFSLSSSALGQTRGWGRNNLGQLGSGNFDTPQAIPVTLSNSGDITGISAGEFYTLYLKADRTVLAAGNNQFGELGDGTQSIRQSPGPVMNLSNVVAVSATQLHSLALLDDGTMRAWGRNWEGQLGGGGGGIGQVALVPNPVTNLTNVVAAISWCLCRICLSSEYRKLSPVGISAMRSNPMELFSPGDIIFVEIWATAPPPRPAVSAMLRRRKLRFPTSLTSRRATNTRSPEKATAAFGLGAGISSDKLHGEGSSLVNRTFSRNYATREICAQTTSLSPFVLAQSPTAASATTSGQRYRHRWRAARWCVDDFDGWLASASDDDRHFGQLCLR